MAQPFNLTARINLQGPYNLRPIVSKIKKDIASIKPELKFKLDPNAAKSVKNVTAELKKLDAAAKNAKKSVGSLNSSLLTLSASFNTAAASSKNAANATAAVNKATASAAKSANQARTAIEEFGKQSGLAIKRFAAFSSVTSVIFGLTNAIQSAYQEFLLFNKEIVRLAQVTDKSVADLKGVSDEITRLSTSIGVASSDLITVASTLAQAGLSAEDTKIALEALAKSALAPSFENITDTTEGAIAAIRQFGLETSQLESALGSINAVAAAFAVESGDIIAAIQRTGGVFASASRGVSEGTDSLNEFIAVFTSIRQTTRESAETIATGLRTIFTRIQRSSTIELLKQYGVELRDLEGRFVGPYEAVRRLSEGLSKIDPRSADFARISEELGGFRQIGKVIPLIQQFAVAQDALNVAQKGSGSLTKDVQVAQQSLAVQFAKTRENFLGLIREIGDSSSFNAFVTTTLALTNGLIDLGGALKPLLPLLLTFGAIKAGSSINQFISGFGLAFNRGGGPGGGGPSAGPTPTGGTGGGPGNQPLTSALALNTTSNNTLNATIALLNSSILALNQNIVNTNSLLLNRPARGFATGGLVPGSGNRDTYSARLTPGEFVLRKKAVEAIGVENLAKMNRGGFVRKYEDGSPSGVKELSQEEQIDNILRQIFESKFKGTYIQAPNGNITVRALKSNKPVDPLGLPAKKVSDAQTKIRDVFKATSQAKLQKQQAFDAKRQQLIDSNQAFKFGLVGLRFGTSAKDKWTGELPPSFIGLESVRETDKGVPVQIFAAALSNSAKIKEQEAEALERLIYSDFSQSVQSVAQNLGSKAKASVIADPGEIEKRLQNSGISNVIGAALEGAISLLGAPYVEKDEKTKSIDFPSGLGSAANLFGIRSDIPTDVTRTIGSPGKGITDYLRQIGRFFDSPLSSFAKYATGGDVSGEDTVPALLTPGEFVFNKKAARSIGYSTLNRLNKADKIKGFNKGGIVGTQRFITGGQVASDPTLIGAALASVLLPQIQRVADSFGKLEGSVGNFGTALGGAIREASSVVLSAGLGLQAVGASRRTTALAQGIGGSAAAIGGALTDTTAKLLEKALTNNTAILGKFDKNLQDIANAPTEELRLEAAKQLEKSFTDLDIALRNSKDSIDNLERLKLYGDAITNSTVTVLSSITAFTALSAAAKQASLAVASSKLNIAGQAATAVGLSTRLLAGFGRLIPIIGPIVAGGSILIEFFGAFSSRLKSSNEQFDRLNKALDETVKNSQAYSLSNKNFVETILPKFKRIVDQAAQSDNPQAFIEGSLANQSGASSALDLRFRQRLIPLAQERGIGIGAGETVEDVRTRLVNSGATELSQAFDKVIAETEQYAKKQDAISFMVEKQGMTREQAEKEFSRILSEDAAQIDTFASTYNAAKNKEILLSRLVADASSRVQVSLVNLDNSLARINDKFTRSLTNLQTSFEDLDRSSGLLRGEANVDLSSLATRDVSLFKNITTTTNQELFDALQRFSNRTQLPPQLTTQLNEQVQAAKVLQTQLGVALNEIAKGNAGDIERILDQTIGQALRANLGTGKEAETTIRTILNEVKSSLESSRGTGGSPKTPEQLAQSSKILGELFASGERSIKFVVDSTETYGQTLKAVAEQQKKNLEIESQIRQSSIDRLQAEKKASIQLKELFDVEVPLSERLNVADEAIRRQTAGIPGLPAGGTTNVPELVAARRIITQTIDNIQRSAIENQDVSSDQQAALATSTSYLNRLNIAIQALADSGDQVNDVFEALAKQRDQFKSQREVLIDILKRSRDPAQFFQLENEFASLQAVLKGNATVDQAFRALDTSLIKAFNPQQQEAILQSILKQIGLQTRLTATPGQIPAIDRTLGFLSQGGFTSAIASALSNVFARREVAAQAQEQDLQASLDQRTKGTITIFSTFNSELVNAGRNVVQTLLDIAATFRSPGLEDNGRISAVNTATVEDILKNIQQTTSPDREFRGNLATGTLRGINLFNPTESKNLQRTIAEMQSAGASVSDVAKFVRGRLLEMGSTGKVPPDLQAPLIQLKTFLEKIINTPKVTPSLQGGAGRTGPLMQGAFVSPRVMENFSTSATQLSTALTGENNTISQLATAVNNLAPVTKGLQDTVNQLTALVKDGIKLDQQANANVNVTFENGIPLEVDRGLDTKIVDNIRSVLDTTLGQKFNTFARNLITGSA